MLLGIEVLPFLILLELISLVPSLRKSRWSEIGILGGERVAEEQFLELCSVNGRRLPAC